MARYLVNHGGAVHSVNDEDFAVALGMASLKPTETDPAGKPAREATPEEVSAWYAKQGLVYDPATGDALTADEAAARQTENKPAKSDSKSDK